jgi:hypothetical protein
MDHNDRFRRRRRRLTGAARARDQHGQKNQQENNPDGHGSNLMWGEIPEFLVI